MIIFRNATLALAALAGGFMSSAVCASDVVGETTASPSASQTLPMFTTVMVALNDDITSDTHQVGDPFTVSVVEDVMLDGRAVIPKGTVGHGVVTFSTGNGAFGKEGILQLSLRTLEVGDRTMILDGRYREEGRGKDVAAAVTMYAVGPLSALIRGKDSAIEAGRILKAKTGEDFTFDVASVPAPDGEIELVLPDFAEQPDIAAGDASDLAGKP